MNIADLNTKVAHFCHQLRSEGLHVNQSDTLSAIQAVDCINLLDRQAFYFALRSTLCFSPEEYKPFDRVFRGFWGDEAVFAGKEQQVEDKDEKDRQNEDSDLIEPKRKEDSDLMSDPQNPENDVESSILKQLNHEITLLSKIATFSSDERLMAHQFQAKSSFCSIDMERKFYYLLKLLKKALVRDATKDGNQHINFSKTIRKNIQYGGSEIFRLYKTGKSRRQFQSLVTFADISGSMELYFRLYLPLLFRLHRYAMHAEMILFNTTIYPVTRFFRMSFDQMIDSLNQNLNWTSKGTNLSGSLKQFRKMYSQTLSPDLTTVLIFCDGWDRGDMDQLKEELIWLNRHTFQIIWLNPLLGKKGYTPVTQAIETATPYITHMVSALEFQSLSGFK